ncbi:MAG: hypothetical protein FJ387_09680 [Verrucomicrobia bacterium]|nr:hypothetical protein [Verrucomicrobiota bacterium]
MQVSRTSVIGQALLTAGLLCLSTPAADSPASAPAGGDQTLELEVSVIRFKPDSKERVLQSFALQGSASNVVEQLKGMAKSVDVLYRGTRQVILEDKSKALFDATETRPVVLLGQPGAPVPPATVYGLKLEVSVRPGAGDRFALFWEGSLTWSPELMDRRAAYQNTLQFLGKAASVAQQAGNLTGGDTRTSIHQAADIGLTLAQLFGGEKAGGGAVYELPVVKVLGLTGSRYCRSGEVIVNTTAAEAGTKEAQSIVVLLHPTLRD